MRYDRMYCMRDGYDEELREMEYDKEDKADIE